MEIMIFPALFYCPSGQLLQIWWALIKTWNDIQFDIGIDLIELKWTVVHWLRYTLYLVPLHVKFVLFNSFLHL